MATAERIAIQVPAKLWTALKVRAGKDDTSAAEALRRAIWFYAYARDEQDKGGEVLIEEASGRQMRIVFEPK